jgi:hypothetical protein
MPQGKDADDASPSGLGAAAGEQWWREVHQND